MANNFTAQPPAGRPLPSNWQAMAPLRGQQANQDYLHKLENAWRGPLTSQNSSMAHGARLGNQPPAPAAPKRNDARSDARFDGTMRLISEDETMQLWRNDDGTTVQIMKRRK